MEEFLSHFELVKDCLPKIIEATPNLPEVLSKCLLAIDEVGYVYNREYCILAFDKSFTIDDRPIAKIIDKFYRQCSLVVHPDKHETGDRRTRANDVFQKLTAWKENIDTILDK